MQKDLPGTPATKRPYIAGIDGLRAIAVLSVLLYHLDNSLLPGGFVGVDIFFVISGFVVSMTVSRTPARGFAELLAAFYRRRVVRILPAALVVVLVVQLASVLFIPVREGTRTVPDMTAIAATAGLSNVILWRKKRDYFSPGAALNPFTHTWSLAVEEQFYVLFPAFALLIWIRRPFPHGVAPRVGVGCLIACVMASFASAVWFTQHDHSFAFYMLPARFWELALGMLLFVAVGAKTQSNDEQPSQITFALGLGSLAIAILGFSFCVVTPDHFPFPNAIAPVLASALLLYVVSTSPASIVSSLLSLPALRYIGRISYSLYLWHWSVIVLMRWTVGLQTPVQKVFAAGLSLALADASYRLVERPIRTHPMLALRSNVRVVAIGVVAIVIAGSTVVTLSFFRSQITLTAAANVDVWSPTSTGHGGRCSVATKQSGFGTNGTRYDFVPSACQGQIERKHLFLVGDSHAWAYQRLAGNIARRDGTGATIYVTTGCAMIPLLELATPKCNEFLTNGLLEAANTAKAGDVLFLPGLRTARIAEVSIDAQHRLVDYTDEMLQSDVHRLRPLMDRGVRIVLEAPKPVYNYMPIRCADWFNRSNPICQVNPVSASEEQAHRAYALQVFARLQRIDHRIEVWDPFPFLCPDDFCSAMHNEKPLVSDGDHLTGYANDYLTPFFHAMLVDEKQATL